MRQSTAVEKPAPTPSTDAPEDLSPAAMAAALASAAEEGHFDELRGRTARDDETYTQELSDKWVQFFDALGTDGFADLNHRTETLRRQIRDNGVTYNVYADTTGPQRPWALDLFPLIVSPESWRQIEAGVLQRVRVLDRVMADVYGPRELLKAGLLPPALVHGHPGYLRAMHGVAPVGGTYLHIAAFDLARGPDGNWWVVSQRTQAPSGLGYLLENRLAISRLFPKAFEAMHVQRLAATYRALMDGLKAMSPAGADSHIALLTPGPYNETYFEHAYLARYLGLTLVEGSDLTVRDQRLYLKTLQRPGAGARPAQAPGRRVPRPAGTAPRLHAGRARPAAGDSRRQRAGGQRAGLGVSGVAARCWAFCRRCRATCWAKNCACPRCRPGGAASAASLEEVLPQLDKCVIKPTYPGSASHGSFEAALGRSMSRARTRRMGGPHRCARATTTPCRPGCRCRRCPPGSRAPAATRSCRARMMLRVFAVADGPQSWRVLPGGLARLAGASAGHRLHAARRQQRRCLGADRCEKARVDRTTLLQPNHTPASLTQRKRLVTSRAAENLFWLGRYTERTENTHPPGAPDARKPERRRPVSPPLLAWLSEMARDQHPGAARRAHGRAGAPRV